MPRGLVVRTDGSMEYINVNGYEDIMLVVNGWIEAIGFGDNEYFCYANEESKILELPENKLATNLWYNSGQRILIGDYIAGDVVFFGGIDGEGYDVDIPENFSFSLL